MPMSDFKNVIGALGAVILTNAAVLFLRTRRSSAVRSYAQQKVTLSSTELSALDIERTKPFEKVAVVGGGAFGTSLAMLLRDKGHKVMMWVLEQDVVDDINKNHKNSTFFPEYVLPKGITASTDLIEVVTGADMILSVVPAQFVRRVTKQWVPHVRRDVLIVSASKGIEATGDKVCLMSDIFRELLDEELWSNTAFISGPSFAKELAAHLPTVIVVAAEKESVAQKVVQHMVRPFFRMYWTRDIVGVEIGGSIKNVIALACGICDGLEMGNNARAAVITRGLTEMARMGMALGADQTTFMGLAGMGDLVLTCSSELSRNRTVGFALGQGKALKDVLNMPQVAEGVSTAGPAYKLARQLDIDTPILDEVYMFVSGQVSIDGVVGRLLQRPYKAESVWTGDKN